MTLQEIKNLNTDELAKVEQFVITDEDDDGRDIFSFNPTENKYPVVANGFEDLLDGYADDECAGWEYADLFEEYIPLLFSDKWKPIYKPEPKVTKLTIEDIKKAFGGDFTIVDSVGSPIMTSAAASGFIKSAVSNPKPLEEKPQKSSFIDKTYKVDGQTLSREEWTKLLEDIFRL